MINKLKDLYHYLILGRCRKHNRDLSVVVSRDLMSYGTRPACIDCEPNMAPYVLSKELHG